MRNRQQLEKSIRRMMTPALADEMEYYKDEGYDTVDAFLEIEDLADEGRLSNRLRTLTRRIMIDAGYYREVSDNELAQIQVSHGRKYDFKLRGKKYISVDPLSAWITESTIDVQKRPKLRRWFGRSVVKRGGKPLVVVHATHRKFNKIDPAKAGGMAFFAERGRTADFGGRTIHAILRIENPFEFTDDQIDDVVNLMTTKEAEEILRKSHEDRDPDLSATEQLRDALEDLGLFGIWQQPGVVKKIKMAGYDGVITSDTHGGETEYVVFNKRQILQIPDDRMGTFESLVEVFASGTLLFRSSKAAEDFILTEPKLKAESAFPWWTGKSNQWGVAVVGPRGEFIFVRKEGSRFIAGDKPL